MGPQDFLILRRYRPRIILAPPVLSDSYCYMAAKPSDADIARIIDSGTLAEWCGFDTVAPTPPTGSLVTLVSPLQAFLLGLG